jgi:hypothetical protein
MPAESHGLRRSASTQKREAPVFRALRKIGGARLAESVPEDDQATAGRALKSCAALDHYQVLNSDGDILARSNGGIYLVNERLDATSEIK